MNRVRVVICLTCQKELTTRSEEETHEKLHHKIKKESTWLPDQNYYERIEQEAGI
jgi:hypothetical protein